MWANKGLLRNFSILSCLIKAVERDGLQIKRETAAKGLFCRVSLDCVNEIVDLVLYVFRKKGYHCGERT